MTTTEMSPTRGRSTAINVHIIIDKQYNKLLFIFNNKHFGINM